MYFYAPLNWRILFEGIYLSLSETDPWKRHVFPSMLFSYEKGLCYGLFIPPRRQDKTILYRPRRRCVQAIREIERLCDLHLHAVDRKYILTDQLPGKPACLWRGVVYPSEMPTMPRHLPRKWTEMIWDESDQNTLQQCYTDRQDSHIWHRRPTQHCSLTVDMFHRWDNAVV